MRHMEVYGENPLSHWFISDKPQKVSQSATTFYLFEHFFFTPPTTLDIEETEKEREKYIHQIVHCRTIFSIYVFFNISSQ